MSNWVYCTLTISGAKEELSVIRNKIVDNDIFGSLYPTPKELEDTPVRFVSRKELTPKEMINLQKFGAVNWYEWNCNNYGTKWGDVETTLLSEDDNHLKYETNFAWCLPSVGIETISLKFPNLRFTLENVSPEDGGYHGEISWENGEVIFDHLIRDDAESEMLYQSSWKEEWVNRFYRIYRHLQCFYWKILRRMGISREETDEYPF